MNPARHELPDRIAGTLVNRADLLLALARHASEVRVAAAADCGFVRKQQPEEVRPAAAVVTLPSLPVEDRDEHERPTRSTLRLLQAVTYRSKERPDVAVEQNAPDEIGGRPIDERAMDPRPYRLQPEPLQPWSRLWPWLHHVLGQFLPGRRIDLPRLVDNMARLRPVQQLPFRPRLAWAPRLYIVVDGASAMDQFRGDVDTLLARLRQLRGSEGFRCLLVLSAEEVLAETPKNRADVFQRSPWTDPGPGDTVLVLSDLGCFDRDRRRVAEWMRCGIRLQRHGVFRFALSPCPRDRWDPQLARVWNCAPWDRHERMPHGRSGRRPASVGVDEARRRQMLEALLRACSVPLLVESPLLREMRLLLPGADAGLEDEVRHHPEVSAVAGVCALDFQHVDRRMEELADGDDEYVNQLKEALPGLLRKHHHVHGPFLRASETYNLHAVGWDVTPGELAEAQAVFRAGNRARWDAVESTTEGRPPDDRLGLAAWNSRELARMARVRKAKDLELAAACALEGLASGGSAEVPEGIDIGAYERTRSWGLGQHGRQRLWHPRNRDDWTLELRSSNDPPRSGPPPLGSVAVQTPSLSIVFREKTRRRVDLRTDLKDGQSCPMESPRRISLASDSCELEVVAREVPPWATRFGWDQSGLFADFEVAGVAFVLRWIPPGEFVMGSPDDEPGRYADEGPQHRVIVGRGFWLGETPVTQGQYAAVTGDRPSHFEHAGDQAPVERVSWKDCRTFCEKLPEKMTDFETDLAFRLPTEAEWEYACRAGTTTALYTGPLTIKGACNAPELDATAWYAGNSGVDYDGGADSSGWPEKQYDHSRAGTHPVAQKAANPWGLYDMLGNVWEWCEDVWHENYEDAPADGSAWLGEGAYRVARGGGWAYFARYCRCAFRYYDGPGIRGQYCGFRLVLAARGNGDIRSFS